MYWIAGLKVDIPEYVGEGDFRRRIPNNWKQIQVIVRLAKEHPRDGWTVDGLFVPPTHEDSESSAPFGRAPSELVLLAACRGVIAKNGPGTDARGYTCDGIADPEPLKTVDDQPRSAKQTRPKVDLSKRQTRETIMGLKFLALQAYVKKHAGVKPPTKAAAFQIIEERGLAA